MSSMLKKTGGLSFKPKFARRPGAASAAQTPASSANAAKTPAAEPSGQSHTSTSTLPAVPNTETPTPITSLDSPTVPTSKSPTRKEYRIGVEKDLSIEAAGVVTQAQKHVVSSSTAQHPPDATDIPFLTQAKDQTVQYVADNSGPPSSTIISRDSVLAPGLTTTTTTPPSPGPIQAQKAVPTRDPLPASVLTSDTSSGLNPLLAAVDKSSFTAKNISPRHPLPSSAVALAPPKPPVIPTTREAPFTSTEKITASRPSPSLGAIGPVNIPLGRPLMSPSPFPVSDSITAFSPPNEAPVNVPAESIPSTASPKKKRQYRKRKVPTEDGNVENGDGSTAPPKNKRQYRRKTAPVREEQEEGSAVDQEAGASAPKRHRHRHREPTPEDAEDRTIDHATTKVGDLTKDLGIGKKFKHSEVILERQRQARQDAKLRKLEKQKIAMGLISPKDNDENGSRIGTPTGSGGESGGVDNGDGISSQVAKPKRRGLGFDLIDGRLTVNQSSLVIDQHAEERAVTLETVEEDEFTHLVTSGSYMRPSRSMGTNHWTDEETELFYHYLKMFGTDFETISHVFPGKNRRMVKLKFNREEKLRPKRLNAAIMARGQKKVSIDIEDYKAKRRDVKWITQDKFRAETESILATQQKELEERRKERRALGLLDDGPAPSGCEGSNGEDEEVDDKDVGEGKDEGGGEEYGEEEVLEEEGGEYGTESATAMVDL